MREPSRVSTLRFDTQILRNVVTSGVGGPYEILNLPLSPEAILIANHRRNLVEQWGGGGGCVDETHEIPLFKVLCGTFCYFERSYQHGSILRM